MISVCKEARDFNNIFVTNMDCITDAVSEDKMFLFINLFVKFQWNSVVNVDPLHRVLSFRSENDSFNWIVERVTNKLREMD